MYLLPGGGRLTRGARGSAPRASGKEPLPAYGKSDRRDGGRGGEGRGGEGPVTVGPAGSVRPRWSAPASCAPPLPATRRTDAPRTPGPAADRALSLLLPLREARAHAHSLALAGMAEVK